VVVRVRPTSEREMAAGLQVGRLIYFTPVDLRDLRDRDTGRVTVTLSSTRKSNLPIAFDARPVSCAFPDKLIKLCQESLV